MSEQAESQQFEMQKIYLKDASFESPNSPAVFVGKEWQPEIGVQLNSANTKVADNTYEVVLTVTVTAKQEGQTAFLVEIKQAGIFTVSGFEQSQLDGMLGAFCPEALFPFAREAISDLVMKGGFNQLLLNPINFNALYEQHLQQKTAAVSEDTAH